jgi:hypothetical protein
MGMPLTGIYTERVDASSTITRPADTTAYASGDLIANSTSAGSVNALEFAGCARVKGGSGWVTGARVQKSTNTVTSVAMRLHLFTTVPTFTSAGDNSAISSVVVATDKNYIGFIDLPTFTGFSAVAWGTGGPGDGRSVLSFEAAAAGTSLYGVLEARGAFTPGSAEVFTVAIWVEQN